MASDSGIFEANFPYQSQAFPPVLPGFQDHLPPISSYGPQFYKDAYTNSLGQAGLPSGASYGLPNTFSAQTPAPTGLAGQRQPMGLPNFGHSVPSSNNRIQGGSEGSPNNSSTPSSLLTPPGSPGDSISTSQASQPQQQHPSLFKPVPSFQNPLDRNQSQDQSRTGNFGPAAPLSTLPGYPVGARSPANYGASTTPATALACAVAANAAAPKRVRSEKKAVPDNMKDDKYFERRKRNNLAAKRSRDQRKSREDEIAIRASFLERENAILRAQVTTLRDEATSLRQLLLQKKAGRLT